MQPKLWGLTSWRPVWSSFITHSFTMSKHLTTYSLLHEACVRGRTQWHFLDNSHSTQAATCWVSPLGVCMRRQGHAEQNSLLRRNRQTVIRGEEHMTGQQTTMRAGKMPRIPAMEMVDADHRGAHGGQWGDVNYRVARRVPLRDSLLICPSFSLFLESSVGPVHCAALLTGCHRRHSQNQIPWAQFYFPLP